MADRRAGLVRGLLTAAVLMLAVGLAFAGWAIVDQQSAIRGANGREASERARVDQLEADYKARGIPVPPPATTTTTTQPPRPSATRMTTAPGHTTTTFFPPPTTTTTTRPSPSTTTTTRPPPPSTTTTTACAVQLFGRCVP